MACRSCRRQFALLSKRTSSAWEETAARQGAASFRTNQTRNFSNTSQRRNDDIKNLQRQLLEQQQQNSGGILRKLVKSSAQPYQIYKATENTYKACAKEATYSISPEDKKNGTIPKTEEGEDVGEGTTTWHQDFGLPATFSTWSQVTMLHMYIILARIRNLETDTAKQWQQQLVDHFFYDAEERMDVQHGLTARGLRHRYLKDLFIQWRGVIAAYDEGVVKNDAVLASAVWRNIYKASEDVDLRHLAAIVSWIRLSLKNLDKVPDEFLITQAPEAFRLPAIKELSVVDRPAKEIEPLLKAAVQ